jgi:hypothetical protein
MTIELESYPNAPQTVQSDVGIYNPITINASFLATSCESLSYTAFATLSVGGTTFDLNSVTGSLGNDETYWVIYWVDDVTVRSTFTAELV